MATLTSRFLSLAARPVLALLVVVLHAKPTAAHHSLILLLKSHTFV